MGKLIFIDPFKSLYIKKSLISPDDASLEIGSL